MSAQKPFTSLFPLAFPGVSWDAPCAAEAGRNEIVFSVPTAGVPRVTGRVTWTPALRRLPACAPLPTG